MTVDEVVKLVLAISFALSLVGVSFQIMRLISKLTDILEDARDGVKSFSKVSTMLVEDYEEIREEFMGLLKLIKSFKDDILLPIMKFFGLVGSVSSFVKKGKKSTSKKKDNKEEVGLDE